jgi:hypothetical protein
MKNNLDVSFHNFRDSIKLLLLLLLNRLPTDITVGQGLENDIFYNFYNFLKQNITILARDIYEAINRGRNNC